MALELARREADAQSSAWAIAELERRLAAAQAAPPGAGAPGHEREREREPGTVPTDASGTARQLAAALDELDALRKALSQEHEARARAESELRSRTARGEELR